MSNMLLRLMRRSGIINGQVLTFRRMRTACSAATNMPGNAVVNVTDSPICGEYWLMDRADALRMSEHKGYTIVMDPGANDRTGDSNGASPHASPADAAGHDVG